MKLDVLPIGLFGENSYVLQDHDHVLLVDPGRFPDEIATHIPKVMPVDAIVLTHGHEDHTGAADDLSEKYSCPIYIHPDDLPLVTADPKGHAAPYCAVVYSEKKLLEEGEMTIGTFPVTIYHTPGHTSGSVCIRYRNLLFTGDTLFAGSVGRTDLYGGDEDELIASLQFIKTLPHDLAVYPGHGPASTIARELKWNPYLQF